MVRTKKRLTLCLALLVAILAFIWGNSALPSEESGALSGWVGEFLSKFLPFLATEGGLHFLRKLAHFSEFAALGMVLRWLCGMTCRTKPGQFALPVLLGAAAACIDEWIQLFSPGRFCSIWDVLLDCSGILAGTIVLYLCYIGFRRFRRKNPAIH